jgi:hypothetical protein
MNSISVRRLAVLVPVALLMVAGSAMADAVVGFDSDPVLVNQLNDFTSADSTMVHFSDTVSDSSGGQDLIVLNDPSFATTGNALAVLNDYDDSALQIDLDFVASSISLYFGFEPVGVAGQAVLTTFMGGVTGTQVGQVAVDFNDTSAIDTLILFDAGNFDSATLRYVAGSQDLIEVVDNLSITEAIPEPSAAAVFATGALLFGATLGRRSPARRRHREVRR